MALLFFGVSSMLREQHGGVVHSDASLLEFRQTRTLYLNISDLLIQMSPPVSSKPQSIGRDHTIAGRRSHADLTARQVTIYIL